MGNLKKQKATTMDLNYGDRRKQLAEFGVLVKEKQLAVDNKIITSTGAVKSLNVAFL